jgi:activating signal cointegrator 1
MLKGNVMRAITIWQPYATLIVLGMKEFETRGWSTSYRGPLIIHAAKVWNKARMADTHRILEFMRQDGLKAQAEKVAASIVGSPGKVLGVVNLTDCNPMMDGGSDLENEVGFFGEGRFGWKCENPKAFAKPTSVVGKQGLWIPDAVLEASAKLLIEPKGECHGRGND